ncbi:MAG: HNH endonuclease [Chloroflexi bacterium]|nr:HNH endonuclease [Chloroflexota bacterium]
MGFSELLKQTVKIRADFTCCWCNNKQNKVEIHHIIPQSEDGPDTEENAAPLCGSCHDVKGGNPDLRKEIRSRRDLWYETCFKKLNPEYGWPMGLDVPLLEHTQELAPTLAIKNLGVQLTDKDPTNPNNPPLLYLSIFFKESRYFGQTSPSQNERWLYFKANMQFAFSLWIQVRAWNNRDIDEIMNCFHGKRAAYSLHGVRPNDQHARDYFRIEQENGIYRIIMSTHTATNAGISIHARLSDYVVTEIANYLQNSGFAKRFNN